MRYVIKALDRFNLPIELKVKFSNENELQGYVSYLKSRFYKIKEVQKI